MNYSEYTYVNNYLMQFNSIVDNMAYQMLSIIPTNNIAIDFIKCMVINYEGAIAICENYLHFTTNEQLQELSKELVKEDKDEIENMQEISKTTPDYQNPSEQVNRYMRKYFSTANNMVWRMKHSRKTSNIDLDFILEMLPYSEETIAICHNLLQYPIDPRLIDVVNRMITEQSKIIKKLKEIRTSI